MGDWLRHAGDRRGLLAAGLAFVLVGVGIGAFVACGGIEGASDGEPAPVVQARSTVTPEPSTPAPPTGTPGPLPTVVLPPSGEAPAGGDAPSGPSAPANGNIAENAGVRGDLMALQRALQGEIDGYRASTGTDAAVAVTDMQTGETISVRGNVAQRTGCTIHMFALFAITSEFQAGRGNPEAVAASVYSGIGTSYPPQVRAFLDIVFGDFHRGERRGRELMAQWGMSASVFDHVAYYGDGTQNNLLTALETNAVLTKLYRGQLFEPEWNAYAYGVLSNIKPGLNYIIPGQLPAQASVAHKIGYYSDVDGWVVADAGIVTFADRNGRQRAYAITYLSQRAPTEYAGYSFGAHLSRVVWDWMYPRYRDGFVPTPVPTRTPRPTYTPRPLRTNTPSPTPTFVLPSATPLPATPAEPTATP